MQTKSLSLLYGSLARDGTVNVVRSRAQLIEANAGFSGRAWGQPWLPPSCDKTWNNPSAQHCWKFRFFASDSERVTTTHEGAHRASRAVHDDDRANRTRPPSWPRKAGRSGRSTHHSSRNVILDQIKTALPAESAKNEVVGYATL